MLSGFEIFKFFVSDHFNGSFVENIFVTNQRIRKSFDPTGKVECKDA